MYMAKETNVNGKRDLCKWQKRPTYMAKETYVYGTFSKVLTVVIRHLIIPYMYYVTLNYSVHVLCDTYHSIHALFDT